MILIGFTSGKFQLMTTRGHVFISQQWYAEPVQSIQLPNDKKKAIDEIYVMYQTCVCILQIKRLLQAIKNTYNLSKNEIPPVLVSNTMSFNVFFVDFR